MLFRRLLVASAAMLACAVSFADNHEEEDQGPALSDVWIVAPKADMGGEFENAMKAYMAWRAEVDDSREWEAYVPVISYKMERYMYRTCCFEWADQDTYAAEANEKGFGEKFNEMVAPYVDHVHRYIEEFDYENSYWEEGDDQGPYYGVTTWSTAGGPAPEAYEARVKLSQMAKDSGWAGEDNQWLWHWRIGGKPVMMIVSPYSSWADMAPPEKNFRDMRVEEMGDEAAVDALFADFAKGKTEIDYTVWYHREDLGSITEDE